MCHRLIAAAAAAAADNDVVDYNNSRLPIIYYIDYHRWIGSDRVPTSSLYIISFHDTVPVICVIFVAAAAAAAAAASASTSTIDADDDDDAAAAAAAAVPTAANDSRFCWSS